ncbi:MAG: hypothetical protein ACYC27_18215 [Armatimonadota bacterium]
MFSASLQSSRLNIWKYASRVLSIMMIITLLMSYIPSVWGAPVAKPILKSAKPAKTSMPLITKAAALKFTPRQISSMVPSLVSDNTTRLVLRRDSGEIHWVFTRFDVDWHKGDLNLKFGWKSDRKGIASAVWQVSEIRYASNLNDWKNPPGLLASGKSDLPVDNSDAIFYVDLTKFAPKPPSSFTSIAAMTSVNKAAIKNAMSLVGKKDKKDKKNNIFLKTSNIPSVMKSKMDAEPAVFPAHVYYIRLVPLDKNGKCAGQPSNPVEIHYGEFTQENVVMYTNLAEKVRENLPAVAHPSIRISEYAPIQKQADNAHYRFIALQNWPPVMPVYKAGQHLDFTPHAEDKSWWEDLGDFISDVVSFVSSAVNWVSKAYESIKAYAVNLVASVLGDWAKGPLMMALNAGLVALGVPPSLPNFSDLTNMGKDYLISTAADYAGIPGDQAAMAVNAVVDKAKESENGGGNAAVWLKPDPAAYYRPAYMMLEVSNPTNQVTDRVTAYITFEPVNDPDFKTYNEPVFSTVCMPVPHMNPGEKFVMPVCLAEYTQLRQMDTDLNVGKHRFWIRYCGMPAKVTVSTFFANSNTKNPQVTHDTLVLQNCQNAYSAK